MSNEFEPYNNEGKKSEFSIWEFQNKKPEEPPEVDPQELLMEQAELLRQEAIQQGYAEGMQQAQEEINLIKTELLQWIDVMQKPIKLMDDQLVQEIIQTLIWTSQYCIGVELSINPDKLQALFNEVKAELPSLKGNKTFAMHPLDVDWINAHIDEKEIPGLHESLVGDSSLSRGDFYLKGDHNELDGRIQTRLITIFAKYINKDNMLISKKSQD